MSTPTSYQRVGNVSSDPTDYDWQSQPLYLRFDGSDDYMLTNSVDFTGTDKMTVWAGVRKLSDASSAMLLELSTNGFNTNGGFYMSAPNTSSSNYGLTSRGTTGAFIAPSGFVAPVSNVLTGILSISPASIILRANATQAGSSTANQGTGNYGNYPLYIGRRGGTSLPFNGRIFSLIIRGAESTTQQIEQTETYVNQKTKAY
jgi:hypothetical protein